ncbi:MarR family transcriptional regulator [Microbacterium sp. NPDC055683]
MRHATPDASSYWYGSGDEEATAAALLAALRDYRTAEADLQRRTRAEMGMTENELLAIGLISRASRAGAELAPGDLARELGLSTASITGLLDGLERAGYVERRRHPTDRRRLIVAPTALADADPRATLGLVHERIVDAVHQLTPDEVAGASKFLEHMTRSVREILVATEAVAIVPDADSVNP